MYSFINYGSEFCLITYLQGFWIFEPEHEGFWFCYNRQIYKIRDPVDAGIYFNENTFKFKIDEKELREYLEVSWKGGNWTFSRLEWRVATYFPEKAWDFVEGKGVLNKRGDIDSFMEIIKKWLTSRKGRPIFDLEGVIDLPVQDRYTKVLKEGEHVKVIGRHDVNGDGAKEVVIGTAVDRDWKSPGYVYVWSGSKLRLKYRLGGVLNLTKVAIKPGLIKFFNINGIGYDEIIVFWMSIWYHPRYGFFLPRLMFTIFSFDDLEKLCDPWGKLKKAKEENKESGKSKNK